MIQNCEPAMTLKAVDEPRRWPWDTYTSRDRRRFLLILFLVGTSNYVDKNIIGVILEQIKVEFHTSDTKLGLLSGIAFALFYATLGIPVARWADRGDRKLIMTLSLAVWSVMTGLCGFAATFWQLMAARFGVGAGEAGAIPSAQSLLAEYYSPTERARAIGIFMMSATAGYTVALLLGGWVAQNYGWRAAFAVAAMLGLALVPLTHWTLKEPRRMPEFAIQTKTHESALVSIYLLLGKPAYRNILAAIIAYFLMAYGGMVFIVSLMIRSHGLNVSQAGAFFGTISAVGSMVGTFSGGALADRLAKQDIIWLPRLAGWGMIAAMPLYELALYTPTIWVMTPLLLLATVFMWGVSPPMWAALHAVCGSKRRAMAVAVAFFFANLIGLGLGPVIAGSLSDTFAVAHGSANGLRYAMMVVMLVFVPGGLFLFRAARYIEADSEK